MNPQKSVFDCQFDISLGVHYHMRRQQFFETYHRVTGVLSLIFSTSAVAAIVGNTEYGVILAGIVAILQCLDLIVDTRGKGDIHNGLRREYLMLNHELLGYGEALTDEQLVAIGKKITSIEIGEPPVKKILLEIARNDASRNLGCADDQLLKINWFKANTANFVDWPSSIPNQ
ncbi:MAG: hypothetical protein HRU23_19125 [Gammaproteobacteria bacterium]|nr:hypothetical protein [Gammaproteobacteria bacterium]